MKTNYFWVLFFVIYSSFAQTSSKDILFTIDNDSYTTDEFLRVYQKNIDLVKDESQKNIDTYLDLFIAYKLKVKKAFELGLHEKTSFKSELNTYRSQLAKKYVLDKEVTQQLVDEAYDRMTKEVKASHILLKIDTYASPADTLQIYNKLLDIKKRAEKGEDFGTLAENYSEDPSAKQNKGSLGYFSVFKMVYPFESAAFSNPINNISNPIRTRFGYHLIKTEAIRPSRGEVEVAHIMLFKKENDTSSVKPQDKIYDIYAKLKQGENFATLASMYSEDSGSAAKGGKLEIFGTGDIGVEPFEDISFAIEKEGDYTRPFETKYGWHIVQLIKKIPVEKFEKVEAEIKNKVLMDDRSIVIKNHLTDKLEKKYSIKRNDKLYKEVSGLVTDLYYTVDWKKPETYKNANNTLVIIDKLAITADDFLNFIVAQQQSRITIKPTNKLVDYLYDVYLKEKLNLYYTDNLETEIPEFNSVVQEYKEGILLFDLMGDQVWNKAKKDTVGLKAFYQLHKEKYKWNDRYEVKILSSTDQKSIVNAQKYIKKKKSDLYIREKINKDGKVNIMIESGVFEKESAKLPKDYTFEKGVSSIIKQGEYFYVVDGLNYLPSSIKTLEEIKGQVISDYQLELEKKWIEQMKLEKAIDVNSEALNKIKQQLGK